MLFGDADHARGNHPQQAAQNNSDDSDQYEMRELGANELLDVADPFVHHLAHKAALSK